MKQHMLAHAHAYKHASSCAFSVHTQVVYTAVYFEMKCLFAVGSLRKTDYWNVTKAETFMVNVFVDKTLSLKGDCGKLPFCFRQNVLKT